MAEANLSAQSRDVKGKQAAKHLRLSGKVPGVLYGAGENPSLLSIDYRDVVHLLQGYGRNVVVNLAVDDSKKKIKAFIYDIQHEPISGDIIHVDLKHISLKEKISLTVPIRLVGTALGVKNEGAIIEHLMHSVDIKCLPTEIPDAIDIDVTELHLGDAVHVKDLPTGSLEILSDVDSTVVHLVAPKVAAAAEGEEEGLLEEGGSSQPEVIGEEE